MVRVSKSEERDINTVGKAIIVIKQRFR
jgi:hypothetical protein